MQGTSAMAGSSFAMFAMESLEKRSVRRLWFDRRAYTCMKTGWPYIHKKVPVSATTLAAAARLWSERLAMAALTSWR